MQKIAIRLILASTIAWAWMGCNDNALKMNDSTSNSTALSVAQTSAQLASGTSVRISSVGVDTAKAGGPGGPGGGMPPHGGRGGHGDHGHPPIDGLNLLAPTNELLAIIDAESAGDFRGFRIFAHGGATVTNYDADGNTVQLPMPTEGPQGCSFSGKQFPQLDSILSTIVKTVIDFGSGVTQKHDTITITRSGKITITRSGTKDNHTETITYNNYKVNGNLIEGTKTRTSVFNSATGQGTSTTHVSDGKITFNDGTVSVWVSDRKRTSEITFDSEHHPVSGTIIQEGSASVTAADGTVIYSHVITTPVKEDLSCHREHRGPVSGVIDTKYRDNTIEINFGDGSCSNQTITITLNGVTTTKTVGD